MKLPFVIAACIISASAAAQSGLLPAPGIKHRLEVSLSLDREAPAIRENRASPRADLKMRIRISDHAINSDYFGVVTYDFSSVDPANDATVKTIWEDPACHIDRGLPKISIVDIQGTLAGADKKFDVAALPRRVGKHIPDDEIVGQRMLQSTRRLSGPNEQVGIVLQAQTKRSGIRATLDLIATRCAL